MPRGRLFWRAFVHGRDPKGKAQPRRRLGIAGAQRIGEQFSRAGAFLGQQECGPANNADQDATSLLSAITLDNARRSVFLTINHAILVKAGSETPLVLESIRPEVYLYNKLPATDLDKVKKAH
ncbi:hypothetical protein TNIN_296441 [Trichonephila inaurata madagascariensis]|uniref:Uncharacterized protein n=1 Tax=Trichonephila inaurata madagascariensis TaxID=2747483 RepID=A0A8X6IVF8_9ARAC|nr:hypothetical protein TNIN_296441 [Trichonephila inaurata madagascariensis]